MDDNVYYESWLFRATLIAMPHNGCFDGMQYRFDLNIKIKGYMAMMIILRVSSSMPQLHTKICRGGVTRT